MVRQVRQRKVGRVGEEAAGGELGLPTLLLHHRQAPLPPYSGKCYPRIWSLVWYVLLNGTPGNAPSSSFSSLGSSSTSCPASCCMLSSTTAGCCCSDFAVPTSSAEVETANLYRKVQNSAGAVEALLTAIRVRWVGLRARSGGAGSNTAHNIKQYKRIFVCVPLSHL